MLAQFCLAPVKVVTPTPFPILVKTLSNKYIQLEVYMNDSIEAVKGQIQAKEGIPSYELRLMFQGKLLTKGTVSDNAITKESVLTILQPQLKGGGKRARAVNDKVKLDLDEVITPTSMRLQMGNELAEPIDTFKHAMDHLNRIIMRRPESCMSIVLRMMRHQDICTISTENNTTNNLQTRFKNITKVVLCRYMTQMEEMSRQKTLCETLAEALIEKAITSQFCEADGVSWKRFTKELNEVMSQKAIDEAFDDDANMPDIIAGLRDLHL
jgi:hypothetical protein